MTITFQKPPNKLTLYDLPAPLPLMILEQSADLQSLDAARSSCSLFRHIFMRHGERLIKRVACATLMEANILALYLHASWPWCAPDRLREGGRVRRFASRLTMQGMLFRTLRLHSYLVAACNAILRAKWEHVELIASHRVSVSVASVDRPRNVYIPKGMMLSFTPPEQAEEQKLLSAAWAAQFEYDFEMAMPSLQGRCSNYYADGVEEFVSSYYRFIDYDHRLARRSKPWSWIVPREPWIHDIGICKAHLGAGEGPLTVSDLWNRSEIRSWYIEQRRQGALPTADLMLHPSDFGSHSPDRHVDWRVLRRLGMDLWTVSRYQQIRSWCTALEATNEPLGDFSLTFWLNALIRDELNWQQGLHPPHLKVY